MYVRNTIFFMNNVSHNIYVYFPQDTTQCRCPIMFEQTIKREVEFSRLDCWYQHQHFHCHPHFWTELWNWCDWSPKVAEVWCLWMDLGWVKYYNAKSKMCSPMHQPTLPLYPIPLRSLSQYIHPETVVPSPPG